MDESPMDKNKRVNPKDNNYGVILKTVVKEVPIRRRIDGNRRASEIFGKNKLSILIPRRVALDAHRPVLDNVFSPLNVVTIAGKCCRFLLDDHQ